MKRLNNQLSIKVNLYVLMLLLLLNQDTIGQNIAYTPLFTNATFAKTINANLPVGTVAGAANVANGTASYSIPLSLPAGTNGVEPSLSINYNSMGTNGTIGYGWGLSGMSMISRTNSDIYRDGNVSVVDFTTNDKFILDGERLFIKSGIYGADLATYGK